MSFSFEKLIKDGIQANNREPDYKLHPSTHLSIPLRRLELESIGYPKQKGKYDSSHRLLTGTLWHEWLEKLLTESGATVSLELNVTSWLPTGWAGRLDCLLWDKARGKHDLYDFKTTGDVTYVRREPKWEHVQQANLYMDAVASQIADCDKVYIVYIGMNTDDVVVHECTLPRGQMAARAIDLYDKVKAYRLRCGIGTFIDKPLLPTVEPDLFDIYLSPGLGKQERWVWNKFRKGWGAYYGPAPECKFCPYPSEVCCASKSEEDQYLGIYYPHKSKFFPAKANIDYGEPFLEPPDYVLE